MVVPLKMLTGLSIVMRWFQVFSTIPGLLTSRQKFLAKIKDRCTGGSLLAT